MITMVALSMSAADQGTLIFKSYIHNAAHHSVNILRSILRSEDEASRNASDASKTSKCSAAECSFPLSSDVVRLVCHSGRYICVGSSCCDKDPKVSRGSICGEAQHGKADESNQAIEPENWRSHTVLIADPGRPVHEDNG